MAEKVYKKVRVVGCSDRSYEEAIRAAIKKTSSSVHGLAWWEVVEQRGAVDGDVLEFQVTIDVAFKVD